MSDSTNIVGTGIATAFVLAVSAASGYIIGRLICDVIDEKISDKRQTQTFDALKKSYNLHKSIEVEKLAETTKLFKNEAGFLLANCIDHTTHGKEVFKRQWERAVNDYCKLLNGQPLS